MATAAARLAPPGPAAFRPPWQVLAQDIAALPAWATFGQRVAPLLRNLTLATGTGQAHLWLPEPDRPAPPTAPPAPRSPLARDDPPAWPGARAMMPVHDGQREIAVLVVTDRPGAPPPAVPTSALRETADIVALLLHEVTAQETLRVRARHAEDLQVRARRIEADLGAALEAERRRLATWVLTGANRHLAEVAERRRDFAAAVRDDPSRAPAALGALRSAVDDLLDTFRAVVRGVHPSTLRARGTAAALGELAAALPRRIRCTGDLGRRVGWEIESGVYHAAAAALAALPASADDALLVHFSRTAGRLAVRVSDPAGSVPRLRIALADDARRLAALGGGLHCHPSLADMAVIDIWLPESLTGTDDPGPPPSA